jgi:hypothetical protein
LRQYTEIERVCSAARCSLSLSGRWYALGAQSDKRYAARMRRRRALHAREHSHAMLSEARETTRETAFGRKTKLLYVNRVKGKASCSTFLAVRQRYLYVRAPGERAPDTPSNEAYVRESHAGERTREG